VIRTSGATRAPGRTRASGTSGGTGVSGAPGGTAPAVLALEGEVTIFHALDIKGRLLDFLGSGDELELDLSGVAELDSAGLQLLLLARREARQQGRALTFTRHSAAVRQVLEIVQLDEAMRTRLERAHELRHAQEPAQRHEAGGA